MKELLRRIRQILRDRRVRKFFTRVVSTVAAIVVFVTTYALILPAITLEKTANCGIEAHQHDDSCYTEVLVCEIPESDGHHHDDSCYKVESVLTCEIEEHEHSAENGCYDEEGNLICEKPEHKHEDDCYEEVRELVCELEESDGHHHDSSCYEKVLTCGKEVHTHTAACYADDAESDVASAVESSTSSAGAASTRNETTVDDGKDDKDDKEDKDEGNNTVEDSKHDASSDESNTGSTVEDDGEDDGETVGDDSENAGAGETAGETAGENSNSGATEGNENASTALTTVDNATAGVTADGKYVPQLEAINFNTILNDHTGIYYHAVAEDEVIEDSSQITADGWSRIPNNSDHGSDVELGANDLLRVYLAYKVPAGSLNTTNQVSRYRLPGNIRLSDAQVDAINKNVNGIASQYVNMDTLEILDVDKYNARSECQVPENFYKHLFDLLIESLLSGNQVPDQMRGECRAYKQNAVMT